MAVKAVFSMEEVRKGSLVMTGRPKRIQQKRLVRTNGSKNRTAPDVSVRGGYVSIFIFVEEEIVLGGIIRPNFLYIFVGLAVIFQRL